MIVDTSAAVAILKGEPESEWLRDQMEQAGALRMSAGSVLELAIVVGRRDPGLVDLFLEELGIQVLAVDAAHLTWARRAFERFGREAPRPERRRLSGTFGTKLGTKRPS